MNGCGHEQVSNTQTQPMFGEVANTPSFSCVLELCTSDLIQQTSHVSVLQNFCQENETAPLGGLAIWEQFGKVDVNGFVSKENLLLSKMRIPSNFKRSLSGSLLVEDLSDFRDCSVGNGASLQQLVTPLDRDIRSIQWIQPNNLGSFYLALTKNNLKLKVKWIEFELWSQRLLGSLLFHVKLDGYFTCQPTCSHSHSISYWCSLRRDIQHFVTLWPFNAMGFHMVIGAYVVKQ